LTPQGRLLERWAAPSGQVDAQGLWLLDQARRSVWPRRAGETLVESAPAALSWQSHLSRGVVSAALLKANTMSTTELFLYTQHLSEQEQSAQRYEIQFWRKALYPLACLVMVALALPFAYLHARAGGVSAKVFGGIMLGISFVLLNHLAGHLGLLNNWTPWAVAAAPGLLYLGLSMAAFTWLVRYR
jgi:lipopolysaccharide export system permease protein